MPPRLTNEPLEGGTLPEFTVLIVDDQLAVREGVARLIGCAPLSLRAVATAATTAEALAAAEALHPDVIVLDADLAGEDGLALIPRLAPDAGVLVLTCHGDEATRERARRLGAIAFVEKHQPAAVLLESIAGVVLSRSRGDKAPGSTGGISLSAAVESSAAPRSMGP